MSSSPDQKTEDSSPVNNTCFANSVDSKTPNPNDNSSHPSPSSGRKNRAHTLAPLTIMPASYGFRQKNGAVIAGLTMPSQCGNDTSQAGTVSAHGQPSPSDSILYDERPVDWLSLL